MKECSHPASRTFHTGDPISEEILEWCCSCGAIRELQIVGGWDEATKQPTSHTSPGPWRKPSMSAAAHVLAHAMRAKALIFKAQDDAERIRDSKLQTDARRLLGEARAALEELDCYMRGVR